MRNRVKDNQGNVLANVPTMKRVSTLRILAPFTSFIKSSSPLSDFFSFFLQTLELSPAVGYLKLGLVCAVGWAVYILCTARPRVSQFLCSEKTVS